MLTLALTTLLLGALAVGLAATIVFVLLVFAIVFEGVIIVTVFQFGWLDFELDFDFDCGDEDDFEEDLLSRPLPLTLE